MSVRDDPNYAKFFKLLQLGQPEEHVMRKMEAEGLNPALLFTPDAILTDSHSTTPAGLAIPTSLPPPPANPLAGLRKTQRDNANKAKSLSSALEERRQAVDALSSVSISIGEQKRVVSKNYFVEKSEMGFVGLTNQGATCYLNSLLQVLFPLQKCSIIR